MLDNLYRTISLSSREYCLIYNSTIFNEYNPSQLTQAPDYVNSADNCLYLATYLNKDCVSVSVVKRYNLLPFILSIGRLNRGPHFLKPIAKKHYKFILKSIYDFLRKNNIYILIFAPNILIDSSIKTIPLISFKLPLEKWSSTYIKLDSHPNLILNRFKSKWRNTLRKGLKTVVIKEVFEAKHFHEIVNQYLCYAQSKSFKPVNSNNLEKWWLNNFLIEKRLPSLSLYKASLRLNSDKIIGAIGVINYAHTSQYLFGFSNEDGRSNHANSVLLWYAIKESLFQGNKIFDLGGLSDSTPYGIRKFKNGLNGDFYSLIGEYLTLTITL